MKFTISKVCPEFEFIIAFCILRLSPSMTKENRISVVKKNHVEKSQLFKGKNIQKEGKKTYKNNFKNPKVWKLYSKYCFQAVCHLQSATLKHRGMNMDCVPLH